MSEKRHGTLDDLISEACELVVEKEAAALDDVDTSLVPEDLQKKSFDEWLEDLRDREAYDKAMAEHRANPKTYTFDEVLEELGITREELDALPDAELELEDESEKSENFENA